VSEAAPEGAGVVFFAGCVVIMCPVLQPQSLSVTRMVVRFTCKI